MTATVILLLPVASALRPAPVTFVMGAASLTGLFAATLLGLFLIETVFRNGRVSVESKQSGLGGGMGEWGFSRALIYMMGALFFGCLTAVIVVQYLQSEQAKASQQFELQKAREADERKYQDAEKARGEDLEKARLAVTTPQKK